MLDNFTPEMLETALDLAGQSALEVSGNRTLDDVKKLPGARDLFLSSGALTKHVQAIEQKVMQQKLEAKKDQGSLEVCNKVTNTLQMKLEHDFAAVNHARGDVMAYRAELKEVSAQLETALEQAGKAAALERMVDDAQVRLDEQVKLAAEARSEAVEHKYAHDARPRVRGPSDARTRGRASRVSRRPWRI